MPAPAIPAGILLLASLAQAGAEGYSAYSQAKSLEESTASNERISQNKLAQDNRQFLASLRQRKKEAEMSNRATAVNMLAGLQGLRQSKGTTTADYLSFLGRG